LVETEPDYRHLFFRECAGAATAFSHTTAGDLTPYISAYFDTTTGAKINASSYEQIAVRLERSAHEMAFISDVTAELEAARSAGLQVLLCERIGNRLQPPGPHTRISDFSAIFS
jgi:methionine salvage enolase-phosphatase E1